MPFKKLDENLSVSPQLTLQDVELAARDGFRTIINNRPDDEEPDQLRAAVIEAAAREHGLVCIHIPVVSGNIAPDAAKKMAAALSSLPGPVLAYCRTGTRSTVLWALGQASHRRPDDLIKAACGAGYDLENLRPLLQGAQQ